MNITNTRSGDETDVVDEIVRDHPRIAHFARYGWIAKGVVYFLMGLTTISIARQQRSDEEASPSGALAKVAEQPGGRVLLAVLVVGLALYVAWRALSVALIRGHDASDWVHRIGYSFSTIFYVGLAWAAASAAVRGDQPQGGRSNVERVSQWLLEMAVGRWLLALAGIVTVGVAVYFVVSKAIMRSFVDDLAGVATRNNDETFDRALLVSGVIGWIGRGVIVGLVGVFVTVAAVQFDADEAKGYDGALREIAVTPWGSILVWCAAIGLIAYGAFCLLSHDRRRIVDASRQYDKMSG